MKLSLRAEHGHFLLNREIVMVRCNITVALQYSLWEKAWPWADHGRGDP
jgi:hypothetical protein